MHFDRLTRKSLLHCDSFGVDCDFQFPSVPPLRRIYVSVASLRCLRGHHYRMLSDRMLYARPREDCLRPESLSRTVAGLLMQVAVRLW